MDFVGFAFHQAFCLSWRTALLDFADIEHLLSFVPNVFRRQSRIAGGRFALRVVVFLPNNADDGVLGLL
jgi:hypothetical protein